MALVRETLPPTNYETYARQGVYFRFPILASVSSLVGRRFSHTLPLLQSVSLLSRLGVSLTQPVLESVLSFVGKGVSRTRPVPVCVSSRVGGEILLHAHDGICVFFRRIGGLSGFSFDCWGVSTARPCRICPVERWLGSFSYTSLVICNTKMYAKTSIAVSLFLGKLS